MLYRVAGTTDHPQIVADIFWDGANGQLRLREWNRHQCIRPQSVARASITGDCGSERAYRQRVPN